MQTTTPAAALLTGIALNDLLKPLGLPVYPCISPADETLPYIIYRRSALDPLQVKTGHPTVKTTHRVAVYSATYTQSANLAADVVTRLNSLNPQTLHPYGIRRILLINAEEGYDNDAFYQLLTFETTT